MNITPRRAAPIAAIAAMLGAATGCATVDPLDSPAGVQPSPVIIPQQDLWAMSGLLFEGGLVDARFAVERAHDPAVREHARRLADYYSATGPQFSELLRRQEIETRAGAEAERLRQAHQSAAERLGRFHGEEFDRHWLEHQVTTSRQLIERVDSNFMPAAAGIPELQAELRAIRARLEQNLQQAERLRTRWQ